MQLIVEFTGRNDNVDQEFPDAQISGIRITGNKLVLYGDGKVVARAELYLDHNRPLWRLKRGARGHEIGDWPEIQVYL